MPIENLCSARTPRRWLLFVTLAIAVLLAPSLMAQRLIPFQGQIAGADGMPVSDGVYRVTFAIYDAQTGATALNDWVESHENVSVIGGQINVLLGSIRSLDDPNDDGNTADSISFAGGGSSAVGPRYLGIKIGEVTNQEMVPRHELVPTFHARAADRVVKGGIQTDQLADGAVTTVKLHPRAGVPVGAVVMWWGALNDVPEGFEVCDGAMPTTPGALLVGLKPNLTDRIPIGAGGTYAQNGGDTGGSSATSVGATALTEPQMAAVRRSGGRHSHFEYGGIGGVGLGQCQKTAGGTPPAGESWRYVMGYQPNDLLQCPQVGVTVNFPDPPGGVGEGLGQAFTDSGTRGATHTHARELPPYLGMHFIIRVK